MTDYVKSTNFASKDSLAIGNPLKIVKGTEIDAEFNNIATAVATKADLNSPALIGTPSAPTAAPGTNTTQVATTAFVAAVSAALTTAIQALYPVGSVYTNATNSANPSTYLGFGTWTAFGAGRVPVGFDGGDSLFNAAEKTGGSKDATLVSHSHTGTTGSENNNHSHTFSGTTSGVGDHQHAVDYPIDCTPYAKQYGSTGGTTDSFCDTNGGTSGIPLSSGAGAHSHTYSGTTSGISTNHQHGFTTTTEGSSATNANVQPYITVYMWKRTA
jgi:hypothetical protein